MKTISCDICNGKIEIVDEGKGVCVNCGITYSVDRLRQKFNSVNDTTGTNNTSNDTQLFQTGKYEIIDNVLVKYHGQLSSVKIPYGVTKIKKGAFEGCDFVKEIILPESLKIIDSYAFSGCKSLKEITIPGSVKTISSWTFAHEEIYPGMNIQKLIFEEGVERIENCILYGSSPSLNNSLQVILPKSLKYMSSAAFMYRDEGYGISFTPKYIFPNGKSEELQKQIERDERRQKGLCTYCGGSFKGLFKLTCSKCGREKDYKYNL